MCRNVRVLCVRRDEVVAEAKKRKRKTSTLLVEWGIIVKWIVKVAPIEFYD